jgi:hypothetical protein
MCLEKLFSKCLEKPNRNSDYPSDDDESVSQNTPKKMGAGASAAKGAREAEVSATHVRTAFIFQHRSIDIS